MQNRSITLNILKSLKTFGGRFLLYLFLLLVVYASVKETPKTPRTGEGIQYTKNRRIQWFLLWNHIHHGQNMQPKVRREWITYPWDLLPTHRRLVVFISDLSTSPKVFPPSSQLSEATKQVKEEQTSRTKTNIILRPRNHGNQKFIFLEQQTETEHRFEHNRCSKRPDFW